MAESARTDKWLWAVRLYKTRSVAAAMCASAKVKRRGHAIKAATPLHPGDRLELPFPEGPGTRVIRVLGLIEKRVGAAAARACYEEQTTDEVRNARQSWQQARSEGLRGRPTKKNRRDLNRFRGFFE